jgi:hypothetical protein
MRETDLGILASPLAPGEELCFEGREADGLLQDGLLCAGRHVVGYVESGVASLVAPDLNWPVESISKAKAGKWVENAWRRWRRDDVSHQMCEFADELADAGTVLEVGCGPGGGLTPGVLQRNPDARVIMNELSIRLLHLWRAHLRRAHTGANVLFVAYDASMLGVLRPNTVQAIANSHGFGSTEDPDQALLAAYCAAAPGALVRFTDLVVDPEEWRRLPESFRQKWSKIVCDGWCERLTKAGFEIESHELVNGPLMDPDEGGLPSEANALGFRLHKSFEYIRARKPYGG